MWRDTAVPHIPHLGFVVLTIKVSLRMNMDRAWDDMDRTLDCSTNSAERVLMVENGLIVVNVVEIVYLGC